MASLSDDEVLRRCQDLVYQVAYSFYDTPYILLLKLLLQFNVIKESELAEVLHLSPNEVRKYLGMLHVHHLIKRYAQFPSTAGNQVHTLSEAEPSHVNKEKQAIPDHMLKSHDTERFRARDVAYWYIDYREFANVVKYRIAMMRKSVDEKLSSEVGHRGYICPRDGTSYAALDLSHLYDPETNSFVCELCHAELIEQTADDAPDGIGAGQDKMQRFNKATAPIRDALRAVEGITLPSLNIMAWIAVNVKSQIVEPGKEGDLEGDKKITVVIGGEEEREIIERERLAEQQRKENALPIWHTHSTVTGAATSLGLNGGHKRKPSLADRQVSFGKSEEDDEDALMAHYAELNEPMPIIKPDPGATQPDASGSRPPDRSPADGQNGAKDKDEDEEDEEEDETPAPPVVATNGVMVMAKPVEEVTEEDQELMTPDEYQAYYEAALA